MQREEKQAKQAMLEHFEKRREIGIFVCEMGRDSFPSTGKGLRKRTRDQRFSLIKS